MTRSVQHLDRDIADVELFTVFGNISLEFCVGFRAINDRCPGRFAKVNMTADKIGVEMSFENIFYRCLSFIGQVKIYLNVA